MINFDDIDLKILDLLQKNGRMKRNEIAQATGLSVPSVSERMKKLEDAGVIKGYTAILDSKKLGKDITAFVFVSIDSSKNYPLFIERVMEVDEILECHSITGEGSHLLKVKTKNTSTLEKLLARIQSWPGVTGTRTNIVLSTIKETTRIKISDEK
ncbi:transcriptional regulator, AsnC family [Candidatus Thermokryptus mobilis]|uniref:Transcriptional regulator, AsnC family n=1 Tax=Candidatus Thermokryptus mobilis TaxID=1643428 RepID=A0A0S4MWV2_9BACT|nr:Lrp/AsnC family transcriptional regulator [Candidatus Thermokryptus mobilis]CUU03396.1 transcriptional regulator, AsnC family [Candidatus Thermokryptus mobilis]